MPVASTLQSGCFPDGLWFCLIGNLDAGLISSPPRSTIQKPQPSHRNNSTSPSRLGVRRLLLRATDLKLIQEATNIAHGKGAKRALWFPKETLHCKGGTGGVTCHILKEKSCCRMGDRRVVAFGWGSAFGHIKIRPPPGATLVHLIRSKPQSVSWCLNLQPGASLLFGYRPVLPL